MKKSRRSIVALIILSFAISLPALAGELVQHFEFSSDQVTYQPVAGYVRVHLEDGNYSEATPGTPWLPAKYVNVLIPSGAKIKSVSATGTEVVLMDNINIYPAQHYQPRSKPALPFVEADATAYAQAAKTPADLAVLTGENTMRGYTLVSLRLNPLRYEPASQKLYLVESMDVTLVYADAVSPLRMAARNASEFENIVNSLVVNPVTPESAPAMAPTTMDARSGVCDYLIITKSALSNAFERLADYRHEVSHGNYTVGLLTVENITSIYSGADVQAKIRNCISNYVATKGTMYVVLGGDSTIVTDRDCHVENEGEIDGQMPTDLYYSDINGNWDKDGDGIFGEANYSGSSDEGDLGWDVIVGRIPVQTAAQATNYINKVITFEANVPTNLLTKIILGGMVAWDSYTGTDRPSDDVTGDGHMGFRAASHTTVGDSEMWDRRLYRDGINPYWSANTIGIFCDTLTSWDTSTGGDYAQNATNLRAKFNLGWYHLFFSGHGNVDVWGLESGDFASSDATALTNKTCFVYTDACLTGAFDSSVDSSISPAYDPCLSEAFLRNPRGGALAYMGCSRYGWGEPDAAPASNTSDGGPSTVYGYKFYKRLYESNNVTIGKAFAMHKADMASLSGDYNAERWIQFGLNLQGDPAILPGAGSGGGSTNNPPSISLSPAGAAKSVTVSNAISFGISATEPDGDTITLRATNVPASATYTPNPKTGSSPVTNIFVWTPTVTGTYVVAFFAGDKDGTNRQDVTITVTAPSTTLEIGGYQVVQYNSALTYNIPAGTEVAQGGYVIIARNADQAAFETFWGVSLGGNVTFLNAANAMPQINGAETYELKDASATTIDGITPASLDPTSQAIQRNNATYDSTQAASWTAVASTSGNPGSGGTGDGTGGLVINEFSDATGTGNYIYEFVELYYDAVGGGEPPPVAPSIIITDPASASQSVAYATSTYDLSGTCNTAVVGQIKWTNTLTGASGSTLAIANWTIGAVSLNVGNNLIAVSVTNSSGSSANDSVTINRQALVATNPPTISFNPSGTNQSVIVSNLLTVTVTGTDVDGESVALAPVSLPSGAAFTGTTNTSPVSANFTWTPTVVGTYQAKFKATDNDGAVTSTFQIVVSEPSAGGGMETFANFSAAGSYVSGTFAGQDGSTWTYSLARGDLAINGSAPTIKNLAGAFVRSGTISGGVGSMQLKYRKPFSTSLNCNVLVNDTVVGTLTGGDGTTQTWSSASINISGNVVLTFTNKSSTSGQITLDDIEWTAYGSDDTDSDSMPDSWESSNFGTLTNGASGDNDNDGLNNLEEYIAGTSPTNVNSSLDIDALTSATNKLISFPTVSGRSYWIQYKTNLVTDPSWTPLTGDMTGNGALQTVVETNDFSSRVYRLGVRKD